MKLKINSSFLLAMTTVFMLKCIVNAADTPRMYYTDTVSGRPFSKDPAVVKFNDKYWLYYSVPPYQGKVNKGWTIGVATSDNLVDWTKAGELSNTGEAERNGFTAPGAIVLDGKVHLFYQTYGNRDKDAICHAWSSNGLDFTRNPTNPIFRPTGDWNCGRAIDADVFPFKGRLLLYWATRDPSMKIQMQGVSAAPLDSDFTRDRWAQLNPHKPILAPTIPTERDIPNLDLAWEKRCIEAAAMALHNGRLYMFYAGGYNNDPQQIGVAISDDGVRFKRLSDKPFLPNGPPGSWNHSESGHPFLFQDDDGQDYLFYQGNNTNGKSWYLSMVPIDWHNGRPVLAPEKLPASRTRVSIEDDKWFINGKITYPRSQAEGLLMNVRMVNATFEDRHKPKFDADENTQGFLQVLPDYLVHGVRAFTLNLQGGMPGYEGAHNSAFNPDGTLRPSYLERIERVIAACDRHDCVVILGCFYQRQDQILNDDDAVRRGVVNVAKWIETKGFTNVLLEISNEFNHRGFDLAILKAVEGQVELIELAQETVPGLLVSTSGLGDGKMPEAVAKAADFILPHYNGTKLADIPQRIEALKRYGKPIVCNEDNKTGQDGARAAELSVANSASWGYMNNKVNQYQPFQFEGCRDDFAVYYTLQKLTTPDTMVFPGKEWREATPESQGVDSTKLTQALAYLKDNAGKDGITELVIVRNGFFIWKGTNIDKVHGIWSLTKSFTSTALGLLIDDGKATLDTKAMDVIPEMAENYPDLTLRHFTTMTSGYRAVGDEPRGSYLHGPSRTPFKSGPPLFTPPGSKYAYWDSAMNQFGHILTRIAGEPLAILFERRIAEAIDMNPQQWRWGSFGEIDGIHVNGGSGNSNKHMFISARELARFGHLFLNRGHWKGKQLINQAWVDAVHQTQVPATVELGHPESGIDGRGIYGFNWWTNGIKPDGWRKWPGAPLGTYAASGYNNNDMFIIPEWHMVIVRLGLDQRDRLISDEVYSEFLNRVGKCLVRDE